MKVLVTGAAGFLGRECVKQLLSRKHQVITTDRHGQVDLLGDLSEAAFTTTLPRVDAVVHCAAVQYVSPDLPLLMRETWFERNNIQVTRLMCERYGREPETHFINIGTSMLFAENEQGYYDTNCPMSGNGVYSASKLKALSYVQALPNKHATIIPCIIGGIGREGLFRQFVGSMQKTGSVAFPGTGNFSTHMVHVTDAAALIVAVLENQACGLFNAASPEPLTLNDWVNETAHALGKQQVKVMRVPLAPVHAAALLTKYRLLAREQLLMLGNNHVLDIDGSLATGWMPKYNNVEIVKEIAHYISGK